jgi:Chaperone of endosialidase
VATGIGYGIEHTDGSRRLSTYLDAGGCWLGSVSADPLNLFVNNGVSALTIDLSSRVGIGRPPAANKLEIEGDASKTTAGSWLANSDARIKKDIQPVSGALAKLAQVRLVSFSYTDDYREHHASVEDRRYLNVVAQEFREVFPEHVKSSGEKLPDGTEILQVDTYPLTIYSAAAIQELNQELKRRDAENAELKRELGELKQLVGTLAGKLNGGPK